MSDQPPDPNPCGLIGPFEDGQLSDQLVGRSQAESRQRLQALIAEWLRTESLVVLTRAGSSLSLSGKTMSDLESEVLETVSRLYDIRAPARLSRGVQALR
jgi:hypothetical protein